MKFRKAILPLFVIITSIVLTPFAKADIYDDNSIPENIKEKIEAIVDLPSRLEGIDGFKRKDREERIEDNIKWYKKHGSVNTLYTRYCLDIANFRDQDDYTTLKEMRRYDPHHGNINPKNHIWRVRDKFKFENIIRKSHPEFLPKTYIKFKGEKILTKRNKNQKTMDYIKKLSDGKYFIKPTGGMCGNDAIRMTKKGKKLTFEHVTKGKITQSEFMKIVSSRSFLLQEYVENHEDIKKLSPYALNTVRIVTTRFNDDVHILSADLRVCCNKNSVVDNFHKEGTIIHVDTKTGKLARYGHRMTKRVIKEHPITKITFEGYQLPYWKETIEMVKKLHEIFFQIPSIGWDVAITPTGPKIIEGNCGWDIIVPQTTIGGIKELWQELKNT